MRVNQTYLVPSQKPQSPLNRESLPFYQPPCLFTGVITTLLYKSYQVSLSSFPVAAQIKSSFDDKSELFLRYQATGFIDRMRVNQTYLVPSQKPQSPLNRESLPFYQPPCLFTGVITTLLYKSYQVSLSSFPVAAQIKSWRRRDGTRAIVKCSSNLRNSDP